MDIRNTIVNIGKLLLAALAFYIGVIAGGLLAGLLGLQQPATPAGMNLSNAMIYMLLTSPLLALGLALVARGLRGGFVVRALVLSFLMWIAYTVNTQLEASIFSTLASGMAFTIVAFALPSLFCGVAVAFLFPSDSGTHGLGSRFPDLFSGRTAVAWAWRLALAAVAFMPIYWLFGTLVAPFVVEYYQQSLFGLQMPAVGQLVTILFVRSVLYLLACLPVIALWNRSARSLFLSLGTALYVLVGLVYMLSADWMPVSVRLPHAIEIMADEYVYAGVLALLLFPRRMAPAEARPTLIGNSASSG